MYFRLESYAVNTFVDYLRRVFRYNSSWVNSGLDIVQFPSGSVELAFEQFFEDNEKYPVITVQSMGGTLAPIAFNDFIDSYDYDEVPFGNRMQASVVVDDTNVLAVQLPPVTSDDTARAIRATFAAVNIASSGDDIQANLYQNYQTSPTLVASASIRGTTDTTFKSMYSEFFPFTQLTGQDYWVTFQSASGSQYYAGIDTTAVTCYQYPSGSANVTGSINGGVVLPAFMRYGTNFEGSCVIRCMAKNSTKEAYKLSELVAQYFTLAKHAQLSRLPDATDGTRLGELFAGPESAGEFTGKDISIRNIRLGGVENRRRGENDIIFTVGVTVDFFAEWHEDYAAQPLHDITETIIPYDP